MPAPPVSRLRPPLAPSRVRTPTIEDTSEIQPRDVPSPRSGSRQAHAEGIPAARVSADATPRGRGSLPSVGRAMAGAPADRVPPPGRVAPALNQNEVPDLLFAKGIQDVCDKRNLIISVRDPNLQAQSLLAEGHETKSAAVKAKSSEKGPTAGFVCVDPIFTKGKNPPGRQIAMVSASLAAGAKAHQIFLSEDRVSELLSDGNMSKIDTGSERLSHPKDIRVVADYDHRKQVEFDLKFNESEQAYGLFERGVKGAYYETPREVMAIANRPPPAHAPTRFDVVTADYDLAEIYHQLTVVDSNPERATAPTINPELAEHRHRAVPARVVVPHTAALREYAKRYTDSQLESRGTFDPIVGNATPGTYEILDEINERVRANGYEGSQLCHHAEESGNPSSMKPDFPHLVVVPAKVARDFGIADTGNDVHMLKINDWAEYLAFEKQARKSGFVTKDSNPRWITPNLTIDPPISDDTRDNAHLKVSPTQGEHPMDIPGIRVNTAQLDDFMAHSVPGTMRHIEILDHSVSQIVNSLYENIIVQKLDVSGLDDHLKAELGEKISDTVLSIEAAMLAARQGMEKAPAYASFRDKLDMALSLLLDKTDVMKASNSEAVEHARADVYAYASRHAQLRLDLRDTEHEVVSLLADGYSLTPEKRTERHNKKRPAQRMEVSAAGAVSPMSGDTARARGSSDADAVAAGFKNEATDSMRAMRSQALRLGRSNQKAYKAAAIDLYNTSEMLLRYRDGKYEPSFNTNVSPKADKFGLGKSFERDPLASAGYQADPVGAQARHAHALIDDFKQQLAVFGFSLPDNFFAGTGEPQSKLEAQDLRESIESFRNLVVNAARPTKGLDKLIGMSQAREAKQIKRTTDLGTATTMLNSLGIRLGASAPEIAAAVKGMMPTAWIGDQLVNAHRLGALPSRLQALSEAELAQGDADTQKTRWLHHVKHTAGRIEEGHVLNVVAHEKHVKGWKSMRARKSGKETGELPLAEESANRQLILISELARKHKKVAHKQGLKQPLDPSVVDRLLRESDATISDKQREQDRARLLGHDGKRTASGDVQAATRWMHKHVTAIPDSEARARGLYPTAGFLASNVNNTVRALEPHPAGQVSLGIPGATIGDAVSYLLLSAASAHRVKTGMLEIRGRGVAKSETATRNQQLLSDELLNRYRQIPGPEEAYRARVVKHVAERLDRKAEVTPFKQFDKRFSVAIEAVSALSGPFAAARLGGILAANSIKAALAGATVASPAWVAATGPVAVGVGSLAFLVATGKQVYGAKKTVSFRAGESEGYRKAQELLAAKGQTFSPYDAISQAHYAALKSNDRSRDIGKAAISALHTANFSQMTGVLIASATGAAAVSNPITVGVAGVGFTAAACVFGASFAYEAGRQSSKQRTRDSLTDFLKCVGHEKDLTRLCKAAGLPPDSDPKDLRAAAVQEIVRREPELIADALLGALQREMPPLELESLDGNIPKHDRLRQLESRLDALSPEEAVEHETLRDWADDHPEKAGLIPIYARMDHLMTKSEPLTQDETKELERISGWAQEQAEIRLIESPTACYLHGLGVPKEHILAIADANKTKEMDGMCRALLEQGLKNLSS